MRSVGILLAAFLSVNAHAGVVINEILADPDSGDDGNCDGTLSTTQDEFVELVNEGPGDYDLSLLEIHDGIGVRHVIPAGTILIEGGSLVVFSGGAPVFDGTSAVVEPWCVALPSEVVVQVASTGSLGFNNTGDTVTLQDASASVVTSYAYGSEGGNNESLVRDPELTGPFVGHTAFGVTMSPGTTALGTALSGLVGGGTGTTGGTGTATGGTGTATGGTTTSTGGTGGTGSAGTGGGTGSAGSSGGGGTGTPGGTGGSTGTPVGSGGGSGVSMGTGSTGLPGGSGFGSGGTGFSSGSGGTGLPALQTVLINEFTADVTGSDSGYEWVELYNPGPDPVDLTDWTVDRATSAWSTRYTFSGVQINPGQYLVLGGEFVLADVNLATGDTLGFGNASSNGDAIRLVDRVGRTVDTVIYGPDNSDLWLDDLGVATTNVAPMHPADGSLARSPDGVDTNNSAVDFVAGSSSSMGSPNPSSPPPADTSDTGLPPVGSCTEAGMAAGVVINEFLSDPAGSDSDLEWVELFNGGSAAVDLSDWAVASGTSAFSNSGVIPAGTVLDPGMHLVVGQSTLVAEVDVVAAGFSLGNAGSNSDAVQLQDCNGTPVDTVVYGDPNDDLWVDDTGSVSTSFAPVATSGMTSGRVTDGVDTDQSGVDFDVRPYPTPGQDNNSPPETCGGPESGIKVNELNADPDGSDTGYEWVELYHAGTEVIDLTGWSLQTATSSWSTAHTFESGTLSPGEFLVLGGEFVAEVDVVMTGSLGNASSNSDGVRLVDCLGFASDTVIYGGPNDDELMDDTGAIATSLAPSPPSPGSLQRLEDGYDTDQSALDFGVQTDPTPGSSNPALEPVICVPSNGDIVLNEFVPDPEGADGDAMAEFVELYNNGSEDLSVAGWGVDVASSEFTNIPAFVIPGGVIIEAGGYLVIGDSNVENADVVFPMSLGNASSSADGLRLIDCEGSPVDTVIYGDDNPDGLIDDKGEVATPSTKPGENQALGRAVDGVDTNAPEDWVVFAIATPGAANELPDGGGGGGDPIGSRGCGCGGGSSTDAPGGSAPGETGCTTAPAPVGWMWLVVLLGLRRRDETLRF